MRVEHRRPRWRLLLSAIAAGLLTATLAGPALAQAQTPAELLDACRDEAQAAAQRIGACTRLIEATQDKAVRAEAFLQRGVLRELTGESETAVADYSEAIKLDPSALAYFNRGNA